MSGSIHMDFRLRGVELVGRMGEGNLALLKTSPLSSEDVKEALIDFAAGKLCV